MVRRLRRCVLLVLALLACAGLPAVALAHAALNGATPADGSVLPSAPKQLELVFSEPVSPLVMKLVGPDGASHALDHAVVKGNTVVMKAPAALANGTYALSWRVVSEDGHPVGGALVFSIGTLSTAPPDMAERADPAVELIIWLSRFGPYLGLFLGCGGAASRAWLGQSTPGAARFSTAMVLLGLICLPVALAGQGLDALAASAGAFLQPAVWKAAAGTSYVWTLAVAAAALFAALAGRWLAGSAASVVGVISVLLAGLALASSGHASAAHPEWLMRPAVFLHASAIAAWGGALLPLALALRTAAGPEALRRFSSGIAAVVAVLLFSGTVLACVQVGTPGALVATAYGRILLAKLALVALAFLLAGFNRWRLTRPTEAGDPAAAGMMTRVIGIELAVLVVVFGTAALWRFTPPPRALAAAQWQPASVHIHTLQAMADVSVTPGRVGPVSVEIVLMNGEFGSLPAKELSLNFSNKTAGIEPIERQARLGPDGVWHVEGLSLPVPGRWEVELEILISDFEMRRIRDTVAIRP